VGVFREHRGADGRSVVLRSSAPSASPSQCKEPLHEAAVNAPTPPLLPLQQRRLHARRHATTYCYDFPAVFENALQSLWADYKLRGGSELPPSAALVEATELILEPSTHSRFQGSNAVLQQVTRSVGSNDVGVVVWLMTLRTPEWPQGRQTLAVANDITFSVGAFGPREHAVFRAVCDFAVQSRLPLLYLAANSGALVGLDQELKRTVQV
jgi:acetyl-CoA carboxylase / biotin carboxylase 1